MGLAEKFWREGFIEGFKEGFEKGFKESLEELRVARAKKLFRFYSDPIIVAEITDLPLDQVQDIQKKYKECEESTTEYAVNTCM